MARVTVFCATSNSRGNSPTLIHPVNSLISNSNFANTKVANRGTE